MAKELEVLQGTLDLLILKATGSCGVTPMSRLFRITSATIMIASLHTRSYFRISIQPEP